MRNFRQSPLVLLIGGIAGVFLLLSLSRTAPENRSLKLDPYVAKMQLAYSYMQPGPGQAPMLGVKLYKKLVTDYPKRFEAPFQLGTMALDTRQFGKAAGWFEKAYAAAEKDDNKLISLLKWSDATAMLGKTDTTVTLLNTALTLTRNVEIVQGIQNRINELKNIKH